MKAVRTGNWGLAYYLLALNAERHAEEVRAGVAAGMKGEPEESEEDDLAEVEDR